MGAQTRRPQIRSRRKRRQERRKLYLRQLRQELSRVRGHGERVKVATEFWKRVRAGAVS